MTSALKGALAKAQSNITNLSPERKCRMVFAVLLAASIALPLIIHGHTHHTEVVHVRDAHGYHQVQLEGRPSISPGMEALSYSPFALTCIAGSIFAARHLKKRLSDSRES